MSGPALALLAAGVLALLITHDPPLRGPRGGAQVGTETGRVVRAVDGDTAVVRVGRKLETVRYIGIDTPESVKPGTPVQCFGHEAAEYNRKLVEGRRVRLRFGAERRDVYGRLLVYVHRGPTFVNARMIAAGFARTLAIAPNDGEAARFARLQQRAAEAERGLWRAC